MFHTTVVPIELIYHAVLSASHVASGFEVTFECTGTCDDAVCARLSDDVAALLATLRARWPVRTGRRRGTTETFRDKDHFDAAVRTTISAIRKLGYEPTMERVAEYLENQPRVLKSPDSVVEERQLRRYCRQFGYPHWGDVLAALNS